jgi:Transposase, Mutator family
MALDQSALLEVLDALKVADVGDRVRQAAETVYQALIEAELTETIGAALHERTDTRTNLRNGHRTRTLSTTAGDLELRIPKLRTGSFFPSLLERRRRVDQALFAVVMEAYLHGVSTRKVDDLVKALGADTGISKSEVSRICADLDQEVGAFRDRSLAEQTFPYVFLDATYCKARVNHRVVSQAVVIATGVRADGWREVLGFAVGDSEDGAFWTAFLRSLKARGLGGVQLVISDAHIGLKQAISAVLLGAAWQRCRVHWSCKESTWRCWGVLVGERGEERSCGAESGASGGGGESVLGQDRADFADDVTDRAPADLKQVGEGVLGAQLALVEHGREDPLVVGDLLGEHASAGAGQAFPAAASVAVSLVASVLDVSDASGHRGELGAAQSGQGGVGESVGHARAWRFGLVAGDELGQCARGGEPQRGRRDRVMVVVE